MAFLCASRTHVGLRRSLNEDAVLAQPDRGLFVVADGMGGHEAGEVASAAIVEALGGLPQGESAEAMTDGATCRLQLVNAQLRRLAQGSEQPRTIGSTVVGLALDLGRFACFWAGDSRAYRLRHGRLRQLTRDHSLVQELVDAGMLDAASAAGHPNANIVTRAVGASASLDLDSIAGEAQPGDRFLLCSDGLTRHVDDEEIESILLDRRVEQAADRLLTTVLARGAHDNVSLIIVDVG